MSTKIANPTPETSTGELRIDETLHRCPNCAWGYMPGTTVCSHCGLDFSSKEGLVKLDKDATAASWPVGQVSAEEDQPVILQCGNKRLSIPLAESMIVGRQSKLDSETQPDICLDALGAIEKGVSRQHIKLVRKKDLIYVMDMGSSNGTFLNGRPLTRNCLRLLRNGDELQLGVLKVRVVL